MKKIHKIIVASVIFSTIASAKVLADENWYTMSIKGKPYAYFNMKFDKLENKIVYSSQIVRKNGELMLEEQTKLEANSSFVPISFFHESKHSKNTISVKGDCKDLKCEIDIKYGKLKEVKKTLQYPGGLQFVETLPYYFVSKSFKSKEKFKLPLLREDDLQSGFEETEAEIEILESKDNYIKASVEMMKKKTIYIAKNGIPEMIYNTEDEIQIQKSTKDIATKFLK